MSSDTNWELDLKPARPHTQDSTEQIPGGNELDMNVLGALVDIRRSLDRLHARLHVIEHQLGIDVPDELAQHRTSATSQLRETRAKIRSGRADDAAQPTSLTQAAGVGGSRRGKKMPPSVVA